MKTDFVVSNMGEQASNMYLDTAPDSDDEDVDL